MKVKPVKIDKNYVKDFIGNYVTEKYGMCVIDKSSEGMIIQDSVLKYKIPEMFIYSSLQLIKYSSISKVKDKIDNYIYTTLLTLILKLTHEQDIFS